MATRLSVGEGVALALVLAGADVPDDGELPPAGVDAPTVGWVGGDAVECLPSEVARAYAPPPAASTTTTATTMNRPFIPPPPRAGGAPGGPDG
jgi:hypothetical protein